MCENENEGVGKMGSLHYDKLVRDKNPEMIRQAGKQPVTDEKSLIELLFFRKDHRSSHTKNDPTKG